MERDRRPTSKSVGVWTSRVQKRRIELTDSLYLGLLCWIRGLGADQVIARERSLRPGHLHRRLDATGGGPPVAVNLSQCGLPDVHLGDDGSGGVGQNSGSIRARVVP